jgi:hypothetical protein
VKPAQRRLIQLREQIPSPHLGHGPPPALMPPARYLAVGRIFAVAANAIQLGQRATGFKMNDR